MTHAQGPHGIRHGFDPVRLLYAQLLRARDGALAVGEGGAEREQRQLVDQERHLGRSDVRRGQLGGADLEVGDGLAAAVRRL